MRAYRFGDTTSGARERTGRPKAALDGIEQKLGSLIGKTGGGSVSVELDIGPARAQNFEGFATAGEMIETIGDRAFYGPGSSFGFNVLKGDTYLRVSVAFGLLGTRPSETRLRDRLTKLTKAAVKRI